MPTRERVPFACPCCSVTLFHLYRDDWSRTEDSPPLADGPQGKVQVCTECQRNIVFERKAGGVWLPIPGQDCGPS